jgi:hypothetical protein
MLPVGNMDRTHDAQLRRLYDLDPIEWGDAPGRGHHHVELADNGPEKCYTNAADQQPQPEPREWRCRGLDDLERGWEELGLLAVPPGFRLLGIKRPSGR